MNHGETLKSAGQHKNAKGKYFIITLGCQMNEHDSEVMAAMAESKGYCACAKAEDADLLIINTCSVRKKPEDKVASLLGKYYSLKQERKNMLIAVGGCMTQQEEASRYIKERFQHVDLIFGTHALPRLPLLLDAIEKGEGPIVDTAEDYAPRIGLPALRSRPFQAWLPVIYGCNNFCSYCIVPYVRGRERSLPMETIIAEAKELAEKGCLEITLLGQNVNSYGHDLQKTCSFADLLGALESVEGLERIRFMTSHPKDLSPQLIETVGKGQKICEHFHLPVQSGSNRILEQMNRRYTREEYLALVQEIRSAIPRVSITTDIIVGFPGEKESDFRQTAELLEEARFDSAFVFLYSPRSKSAAARLRDDVSPGEKEIRLKRLNDIQHRISREINSELCDRTLEVLVEGPSKNNPAKQTGRTRTNKLVHFSAPHDLSGKLVPVRIRAAQTWNLEGDLL